MEIPEESKSLGPVDSQASCMELRGFSKEAGYLRRWAAELRQNAEKWLQSHTGGKKNGDCKPDTGSVNG